jgi:hypothetical protein
MAAFPAQAGFGRQRAGAAHGTGDSVPIVSGRNAPGDFLPGRMSYAEPVPAAAESAVAGRPGGAASANCRRR